MNAPAFAHSDLPSATSASPLVVHADVEAAGRVLMSLAFRAEDVQAFGLARRWTNAAVDQLRDLARLTDPVDEARAEAGLRHAIAANPCDAAAFSELTSLLSRQGRHDEALEVVDQALGWCSDVAMLQLQAGRVLSAAGRKAEAVEAHHRALALDGGLADAHYELGLLYEDLGEPRLSARHFRAFSRVQSQPQSQPAGTALVN
ncbi:hypothetical protein OU995_08625 [Roseateles sp. SL47]|uniref:hypothetical protein n=1 Tax=Roseateles sp. SL47 TaxID=2995138 RepID=UPI0022712C2E|nr:hypothetical protein [Roseateles sp. SL47]WAC74749.1 hypothetical protein OU995_08625 [Roseateles sp. SL47]